MYKMVRCRKFRFHFLKIMSLFNNELLSWLMAMTDRVVYFTFQSFRLFFVNFLNIQFQVLGNILTMNGEIIT